MAEAPFQRILIIQTAHIGDVVLATPVVEALVEQYPKAAVDVLVRRGNEEIFAHHPQVHETLVWDKTSHKYLGLFRLLRQVRKRRYDLIVNVQRHLSTGLLTALSRAKERVGFDKNPMSLFFTRRIGHRIGAAAAPIHEVARNLQLLEGLANTSFRRPVIHFPPRMNLPIEVQKPYLCFAPGSVWFTKAWPSKNWIALLNRVPPHYHCYLLGGASDHSLCQEIAQRTTHDQVINLAGKLTLLESAWLMKGASMNFTNDSAPMHLASAVNAPVTAIFCATVPWFGFGPLSDVSYVVQTAKPLACRPCGLHGHHQCPKGHFECSDISIEALLEKIP